MKIKLFAIILGCLLIWSVGNAAEKLSSEEIMDRIEARYNVQGIFVQFQQTTTLKALDVIDSAEGRIFIKQPGRIRWEYDAPEKQSIITNGETLWIYRPEDNQVMTGKADTFFGEGMGGVFLSDMTAVRKHFNIKLADENATGTYSLELTKTSGNIQTVSITVSSETFDVIELVTLNAYGDETRLTFKDPQFGQDLADELFEFTVSEGIEVLSLEE